MEPSRASSPIFFAFSFVGALPVMNSSAAVASCGTGAHAPSTMLASLTTPSLTVYTLATAVTAKSTLSRMRYLS